MNMRRSASIEAPKSRNIAYYHNFFTEATTSRKTFILSTVHQRQSMRQRRRDREREVIQQMEENISKSMERIITKIEEKPNLKVSNIIGIYQLRLKYPGSLTERVLNTSAKSKSFYN